MTVAGRGKGGKGLGKGSAKRHRKTPPQTSISKPAIRRLARRGGVKRVSATVYDEINSMSRKYLENVINHAITYCNHGKRKTVSCQDVLYALKKQGVTLIGFGSTK
ncbi:histone H4 [Nematocida sp. AWRm77]|nr:histone H4 [Nematocida sp. AWRm77]